MDGNSDHVRERLDVFVPPAEQRRPKPKTPRKRLATASIAFGSPAKSRTPPSVKREKVELRPKAPRNAPKIIFGLDFGTTYSGIAYTWAEKVDQITVLLNVDNSNHDDPKVPSAINFCETDAQDMPIWGYNAAGDVKSLEWFKLLLVDEVDLPEEVRNSEHIEAARNVLGDLEKTPEEVIGQYLHGLWVNCLKKVKVEISRATVDNSCFHVVITLPAIWPDYARNRMREAVELAGILKARPGLGETTLSFVSEPEAAALATLKQVDGRYDIEVNDSFIVCDCGGGTVDIISYKVTSTEPMFVKEVVKGTGTLCGAIFVSDEFQTLIRAKVDEIAPFAWDLIEPDHLREIVVDEWEKIRLRYIGGQDEQFTIRYPTSLTIGLMERNMKAALGKKALITITSQELKQVFKPVVEKIKALIHGQIDTVVDKERKKPKHIILVGGFGRCKYLYEFLKTRSRHVEVLQSQGADPWTAIARGAVIHGMGVEKLDSRFAVEVKSRIARASYGVICQEAFDDEKHDPRDKFWSDELQSWQADAQMKWLIKEGQDVNINQTFKHQLYKLLDEQPDTLYTTVWICKTSPPPSRKDDTVVRHSEVKWYTKPKMCLLPESEFVNNKGKRFRRLDYVAEMKCGGGAAEFFIIRNGKRQASQNISVEFYDRTGI